ncbi:MAG: hypothetical protein ACYTGN_14660 [Planctomycetota bacterium]|jgi:hypothetical protein
MSIKERLLAGDILRILFADGVGFDVWAEKYANPPQVFFEGKPLPIDQLDEVRSRCAVLGVSRRARHQGALERHDPGQAGGVRIRCE